jgi:protein TonB
MFKKSLIFFIIIFAFFATTNSVSKNKHINEYQSTEYLAFADQMPEPIGGLPSIYKLISYPELAKSAGVEGKVYVLAFINETGGVDDVKIVKGIGAGCDEATIEAIKQTQFVPGKSAGKPAKIKMSLQIQFKLG